MKRGWNRASCSAVLSTKCLVLSTIAALALLLTCPSENLFTAETAPATIVVSDQPARSPYDDWPDQGMRPAAALQEQRDEVFPHQAALINAAYGGYGWRVHDHCCAGWPACIHGRAAPSNSDRYCGYYVGGGLPWFGGGRYLDEGTWGWDYLGYKLRKHVPLNWSHWRYQGGAGAYRTDGPKVIHHD